jgi:hypothetical protein
MLGLEVHRRDTTGRGDRVELKAWRCDPAAQSRCRAAASAPVGTAPPGRASEGRSPTRRRADARHAQLLRPVATVCLDRSAVWPARGSQSLATADGRLHATGPGNDFYLLKVRFAWRSGSQPWSARRARPSTRRMRLVCRGTPGSRPMHLDIRGPDSLGTRSGGRLCPWHMPRNRDPPRVDCRPMVGMWHAGRVALLNASSRGIVDEVMPASGDPSGRHPWPPNS